ncbi:MAG: hypothetical protein GY835_05750 [bacterium]|nr:hypothetical protein [bacterium]
MPAAIAGLAISGGAALTASAIGGTAGALVGAGITVGLNYWLKPPEEDENQITQNNLTGNWTGTNEAIPVIYGRRRVGGTVAFAATSYAQGAGPRNKAYLWLVLVLGEGEVDGYDAVYFDNEDIDGTDFEERTLVLFHAGAEDQLADPELVAAVPEWTLDHRLRSLAYVVIRLKWHKDVFVDGVPDPITMDVRGSKVLDPRTSTEEFSSNPALTIRDFLANPIYGWSVPSDEIHDDSFEAAANYCSQLVDVPDGEGGTTTAPRYTCNGVLDTSQTPLENLNRLLIGCRGLLVESGGLYRLMIDAPTPSTFAFDENNIVGGWNITLPGKDRLHNRVRARFFNKAKNWQPDFAIADSPALRVKDGGALLEGKIDLPFCDNYEEAYRLAAIALNESRQGIIVQFRATIAGMVCEVGDVGTISHNTPGWNGKPFRIDRITLLAEGDVEITCREYDETIYDWGVIPEVDPSPNTDLPSPTDIAAPGVPTMSEELYETRQGTGVKAKAIVAWEDSEGPFVAEYRLEWKLTAADDWTLVGVTNATGYDILDVAPGTYDIRVAAINSIGVTSEFSTRSSVTISGLGAPPAAISNLTIGAINSVAVLNWSQSQDLDVRIGGSVQFRHSSNLTGATWATSHQVGQAPGSASQIVLPLLSGTYLCRAIDSSGTRGPVASVTSAAANVLEFANVASLVLHPTWSGTHDNTEVYNSSDLQLQSSGGDVLAQGVFTPTSGIDAITVKNLRIRFEVDLACINTADDFDSRSGNVDTWEDWDGTTAAPCEFIVEVRTTPDNPGGKSPDWGDWTPFVAEDVYARGLEFRVKLSSEDPAYNIRVDTLTIFAEEL